MESVEENLENDYKIFCCVVYDEHNISIGLKNSFNDKIFRDTYIDKDKSIVIQFKETKDARNFFYSVYLLTKSINNKLDGKNFTISSENVKQIQGLILNQYRSLVDVMEYKLISLSQNKVFDYGTRKTFTSDEVCKLLGIDRQKLAYWRKTKKIKFKKLSDKKFTYPKGHVYELLENMMIEDKIKDKDETQIISIPQPAKVNKRLERLKAAQKEEINSQNLDYTNLIMKWVKAYTHKIVEHKYNRQKFFLNFGNVGITSSPQVMINDKFQLVDFIKKKIIKETPEETWDYLVGLKEKDISPRIDSSKAYNDGYKTLYLNNLRDIKKPE
jgi:hypothetical protein